MPDVNETVNYRAKSPLASRTIITNVVALVVLVLGSDYLKSMLGPSALEAVGSLLAVLNVGMRFLTVRPVSAKLWNPGESVPVAVPKLK